MDPQVVAAVIAGSVGVLTLIGTVIAQVIGFRSTRADTERQIKATHRDTADTLEQQREQLDRTLKAQGDQLDRTLAEQRTRALNERFATAASQLGDDKPAAVRLAGVYAMAGLADDWGEHRQTCVDVLCAYLRMPYEADPGPAASVPERLAVRSDREVRHTVIRVITAHLTAAAAVSWQGLNFDFTGVVFDGGDFSHAVFSGGTVSFTAATFTGVLDFSQTVFSDSTLVSFGGATFSGTVSFRNATFSGAYVSFTSAVFSAGSVDFTCATFSGGVISFSSAVFSGGTVSFWWAAFSGANVDFHLAAFSGAVVDFCSDPDDLMMSVIMGNAEGASFSAGTVSFSSPADWSHPPTFPWTGTPPEGVTLPDRTAI
jgi:hypothetical protein